MSKNKINLDSVLASILTSSDFDNFTVLELRDAYIDKLNDHVISKDEARRFVYRNLLRLVKKGLLNQIKVGNRRKTKYQKTERFEKAVFLSDSIEKNKNQLGSCDSSLLKELTEKLHHYKLEMLSYVGESEEYKRLYNEFPQMKKILQEQYNNSRDESSKFLGRIKALETLIKQKRAQS